MRAAASTTLSLALLSLWTQPLPVSGQRPTAALIVGGYWTGNPGESIISHVELFGCEGNPSVALRSYPNGTYLASGVHMPADNKVLACGGYSCTSTVCTTRSDCFWWNPADDTWARGSSLAARRFNYLMTPVTNRLKPEQGKVPLAIGYGLLTEIYDNQAGAWEAYSNITDRNWYSLACFIGYNDKIYSIRENVVELDPATWNIAVASAVPTTLIRSGMCAGVAIGGHPGIYTRYGYWYDIVAKTWTQKTPPPVDALSGLTNALWSFRGRPTIFGNPICNHVGTCENKRVVQYNPETDAWEEIGQMLQSRTYHTVVEVPGEYCDFYGATQPPPTTTTTTTASTITASTTTGTTTTSVGSSSSQSWLIVMLSGVFIMLLRY